MFKKGKSKKSQEYVRSVYTTVVKLEGGYSFTGHAVLGRRKLMDTRTTRLLDIFSTPMGLEEGIAEGVKRRILDAAGQRYGKEDARATLGVLAEEFISRGLLVPAGEDEIKGMAERLGRTHMPDRERSWALDAMEDEFEPVIKEGIEELPDSDLEKAGFLLLGWCFSQSVRPALQAEARRRGMELGVEVAFPEDLHLISELKPELAVLQLSHRALLAPLLDAYHTMSEEETRAACGRACSEIRRSIKKAAELCGEGRLLVQGIAAPQTSPMGMADFKRTTGFFDIIRELNRAAMEETSMFKGGIFLDEEALLSRYGKRNLLDDMVSTYSHHGAPEGSEMLQHLLASAYLDAYEAAIGRGRIRCVAVDLDGTLWPGEIADSGFSFSADEMTVPLMYGRYGGLHQALKILKARGILLAVASKNEEGDVLSKWRPGDVPLAYGAKKEETGHYLSPDDFTVLKIDWRRKSEMLKEIIDELGITRSQLAFIDDNPIEREEVGSALPGVMVLGDDMDLVREALLTSPRFQVLEVSEEAGRRTETTKARLQREREASQAVSHEEFLGGLGVRCTVRSQHDERAIERIAELLNRTNQFNTTKLELSAREIAELASGEGSAVLSMSVSDRFADYGLVGAAVVRGSEISGFALSCRVIGLESEVVLLRRALLAASKHGQEGVLRFARTERNLPATRLYQVPGFTKLEDGSGYGFSFGESEIPADPEHCEVVEE